jgi:hypothetical protein
MQYDYKNEGFTRNKTIDWLNIYISGDYAMLLTMTESYKSLVGNELSELLLEKYYVKYLKYIKQRGDTIFILSESR